MAEIAGSFYLFSTAAFAIFAIVIGIRLELLYRRTRKPAERMLGFGVAGTAGLGYGVMMIGIIGRSVTGATGSFDVFWWISFAGWIFHNLGVMCILRFVRLVFRPDDSWAHWLARVMVTVLWTAWALYVYLGGLATGMPNAGYWMLMTVVGTYPLWAGIEAFLFHRNLRRRLALGLTDPIVCNRVALWSLASLCTALSIWTVNLPYFLGVDLTPGTIHPVSATCMLATAIFGLATIGFYWLTFFPPSWYRRMLERSPERAASA